MAFSSPAPPPPPVWGVAFLRPALVQHGSAVVHHLCSGTAAAGEAGTPRWGYRGCGCCAVRGRRGRPRARNRGRGGSWNEEQILGFGIQGLEEELPVCRPEESLRKNEGGEKIRVGLYFF